MNYVARVLFVVVGAIAWHDLAQGQSRADLRAAEELEIPGLHLLDTRHADSRLSLWGIRLAYVESDVRLGSTGQYYCGTISADRAVIAAGPVSSGLARLPYETVYRMGLRYVVLCGGARSSDRAIGGIPVPPLNLLMLDVGSTTSGAYLESSTLHELYHMAELRIEALADAEWNQQFSGYADAYAPNLLNGRIGSGNPGFLNAYSQTFAHEDRAELFSELVQNPSAVVAHIRATGDAVLRRKVLYMNERSQRLLGLKLAPDGL